MRILVLEDAKLEGRTFKKDSILIMSSKEAQTLLEKGFAIQADTDRSVGLKTSKVEAPVIRETEKPNKQKKPKGKKNHGS